MRRAFCAVSMPVMKRVCGANGYTHICIVCIRELAPGYASAGLCSGIRASVWRKAGARLHSGYSSSVFPGGRHEPGAIRESVKMNIEVKFMKYLRSG